jgi:Ca-activated chloride channel homolog
MNRTTTFLGLAAGLGLIALVVGLPKVSSPPPPPEPARPPPTLVAEPPAPMPAPPPPAEPKGSLTMQARLSHPLIATGKSDVFATVDISAVAVPGDARAPVSMALVIDRSGSMNGAKLANAKAAAKQLVAQLRDGDRLAIVHYGSDVRMLPSLAATAENRAKMNRYISGIWDDGGTNIAAGLNGGFAQVSKTLSDFRVNRVLLISDGEPTEGITSSDALSRIARKMHDQGVTVSALGVGYDFNEDVMQKIAELGAGSYGYFKDSTGLASVFQKDLEQAATMVARGVNVSFTLPAGVELAEVLGYASSQSGRVVTVAMPDFSGSQNEKLVVKLSVTGGAPGSSSDVTDVKLSYTDLLQPNPNEKTNVASYVEVSNTAHLASLVTDKPAEAHARRDKDAVVIATRAQTSVNYKRAAKAASEGRYGEAKRAIEANNPYFDDAAVVGGAADVKADRENNERIFGLIQAQPSAAAPARADAIKQLKYESQRAAGKGDSLYAQ